MVAWFPAPASFTGEDVVEIHAHGGVAIVRAIFEALGAVGGGRPAEAGEFTRRAYLNGRLDLLEVEALGERIAAETEQQLRQAVELTSRFHAAVQRWREHLIGLLATAEASIDFSDERDVQDLLDSAPEQAIRAFRDEMRAALDSLSVAERVRDGFRVAILGPVNAGKSTLFNALVGRNAAITSAQAGTTRDVLEARLDLAGYPVVLMDTAGFRSAEGDVEKEGIDRARRAGEEADVRLWVAPFDSDAQCPYPDATRFVSRADQHPGRPAPEGCFRLSVVKGEGMEALQRFLRDHLAERIGGRGLDAVSINLRQADLLRAAIGWLDEAVRLGADRIELRAEALRAAAHELNRMVGKVDAELVLDRVFSQFCIGK